MNKWNFEIHTPKTNYLRGLHDMPSDDICISEQENDNTWWLLFSSPHLNAIADPNEVFQKTTKFKMLIDGISYIVHENKSAYSAIVLRDLYDENGQIVSYNKEVKNNIFDFKYDTKKTNDRYKSDSFSLLIHIAGTDKFVQNLLMICSGGMEYVSLYKALDEIKTFLKAQGDTLEKLGITKTMQTPFTHTANNFTALGVDARHGDLGHPPPAQPLELQKAQEFITYIIKVVLKKYFWIVMPCIKDSTIIADDLF